MNLACTEPIWTRVDDVGRLVSSSIPWIQARPPSGWGTNPLAGYAFTYDVASRITWLDSYLDGLTTYTFDNTNQLTGADHTGQTDESYSYDANANRTMTGYSTGSNNQLQSDGTYNYTYDDEGNRLTKTNIATGEREEYTWDWRNRLTKITFKDSGGNVLKSVDQTYDYLNRWVRRSVDDDGPGPGAAVDTLFSHQNGQIALQFDGPAASNLSHRYFWNPAAVDQLLADESVTSLSSPGSVLYPLADHLGTIQDLASHNSATHATTIDNHRKFDSYGNVVSETNSAIDEIFGYTGRALDESTGLQNNLNRWYDPSAGRWISEDPIGFRSGDSNLYRYVGNSPTVATDPNGLFTYMSIYACFNGGQIGCWVSAGTCTCDLREPTTAVERPFFLVMVEMATTQCCFSVGQRVANGTLFASSQPGAMMACVQSWLRGSPFAGRVTCYCT